MRNPASRLLRCAACFLGALVLAGCTKTVKEVVAIKLGPVTVQLLQAEPDGGSAQEGTALVAYAGSHAFAYLPGDEWLVVDSGWYEQVKAGDLVVFAQDLVFVNGRRQMPQVRPAKYVNFMDNGGSEELGPVTFKPAGGNHRTNSLVSFAKASSALYSNGLQAVEIRDGHLYVYGLNFGPFGDADHATITPDSVAVNGKARTPQPEVAPANPADNDLSVGPIKVKFLEAVKSFGGGSGGGGSSQYWTTDLKDHVFGYEVTSAGGSDLFVDSWWYGPVIATDEIVFGRNLVFVNGVRRAPGQVPAAFTNFIVQPGISPLGRGSSSLITFSNVSGIGSGSSGFDPATGSFNPTTGASAQAGFLSVRINGGFIYDYGLNFGPFGVTDKAEVSPEGVAVNGIQRSPQPEPPSGAGGVVGATGSATSSAKP